MEAIHVLKAMLLCLGITMMIIDGIRLYSEQKIMPCIHGLIWGLFYLL